MISARYRLDIDCSMKVAGRKIVGSISTSGSAGLNRSSTSSTPAVTDSVFAPSCFSTISSRPGHVVDDRVADGCRVPSTTLRDITERHRRQLRTGMISVSRSEADATAPTMRDSQPLVRRVHESTGGQRDAVARRLNHVGERHVPRGQALRIDKHLKLPIALPPNRHVRHAGHGHQLRAHRPADQGRQFHLRQLLGPDPDLERAAERGERRQQHRRCATVGNCATARASRSCTVWRVASRSVGGARIITTDDKPSTDFDRTVVDAGDAGERGFNRHADERFHLRRGEARRFGLDFDDRRRELGKDVEGDIGNLSYGSDQAATASTITTGAWRSDWDTSQPIMAPTCLHRTRCRTVRPRPSVTIFCPARNPRAIRTFPSGLPRTSTRRRT